MSHAKAVLFNMYKFLSNLKRSEKTKEKERKENKKIINKNEFDFTANTRDIESPVFGFIGMAD